MPTTAKYAPRIVAPVVDWNAHTALEVKAANARALARARVNAKPVSLWARVVAWLNSDV